MATNPFQASGTNDVPALRRAITAAFVELVRQLNRERNVDNTTAANSNSTLDNAISTLTTDVSTLQGQIPTLALLATRGDAFPLTPQFGDEFYLNADVVDSTDPDNPVVLFTQGWYKYSDQWDVL